MRILRLFGLIVTLSFLMLLAVAIGVLASDLPLVGHAVAEGSAEAPASTGVVQRSQPLIIDHTCTDLSKVPQNWIVQAKNNLRLSYGHTSHGSQPVTGMAMIKAEPSFGALYDFNTNGAVEPDVLSLADRTPAGDLGNPDRVTWEQRTRDYLEGSGADRNVVVWSWCGQANTSSAADIDLYLNLMNGLEQDYPDVTFVYMTGHLEGDGPEEDLYQRNNQIREYCRQNNKVLFDFADIESYDPDGNYYPYEDDVCLWCSDWCATHDCPSCESCAHSHCFNCYLKGQAFWWMLARLAGWSGVEDEAPTATKTASTESAVYGQRVTYTVVIEDSTAPSAQAVHLVDELPMGVSYVSGTLTSTAGTVDDSAAPLLGWTGPLSPAGKATVSYAVTVTAHSPQLITNHAVIDLPGYGTLTRTATITVTYAPGQPDLGPSYKTASARYVDYGDRITYTVVLRNASGPLSDTVRFTDTIQDGLAYVSGTMTATTGTISDTAVPTLYWWGILTPTPAVTITYAADVVTTSTLRVLNVAEFLVGPGYWGQPPLPTYDTREATIFVNGHGVYLPMITRFHH